jgi:dTDP-4-amino-4,6-dideoxygalactose transaminase
MSELNAAYTRFQLRSWTAQEVRRKRNAAILERSLTNVRGVTIWAADPGSVSPFVFPISVTDRRRCEAVVARLANRGVETRTLMGGAMADQPAFRDWVNDGLANCRARAGRTFFVGIHQSLAEADVADVAGILAEELGR